MCVHVCVKTGFVNSMDVACLVKIHGHLCVLKEVCCCYDC